MNSEEVCLVHGAPGDIMCSIGHILQLPNFNGRFLLYSRDKSVAPFMRAQPFCKEVILVEPASVQEYLWSIRALCVFPRHHPQRKEFVLLLAARSGIPSKHIREWQVSMEMKHTMEPVLWKTQSLPIEAEEWAEKTINRNGKPNVIIHPYSFQSNTIDRHWPHWEQALEWFCGVSSDYNFFLTGIGWGYSGNLGKITNLVNSTPSNNHVLALQKRCDLTVATSCNLSHWATCIDKPIINAINMAVIDKRWYFRKAYNFPLAMFVEFQEPFKKMRDTFLGFFKSKR